MFRPLTARALTSAMDTLRPYLNQAEVLDLYSGEGRFAFATIKEGASHVTLIEIDHQLATQAKWNLPQGKGKCCTIVRRDALKYLASAQREGKSFHIIFADPPFSFWNEAPFSRKLFEGVGPLLLKHSIFLVKKPRKMLPSPTIRGYHLWKTSVFGESRLLYFTYDEETF